MLSSFLQFSWMWLPGDGSREACLRNNTHQEKPFAVSALGCWLLNSSLFLSLFFFTSRGSDLRRVVWKQGFVMCFIFLGRVSRHSPGYPGTQYTGEIGLELSQDPQVSAPKQ